MPLREVFSEYGLIKRRLEVELRWLDNLSSEASITEVPQFSESAQSYLMGILERFDESQAEAVKAIERTTNHDVKAIEYFIKEAQARHYVCHFLA